MPLPKEQIRYLARLAGLNLAADELNQFSKRLVSVVEMFERLADVNTDGVVFSGAGAFEPNRLRKDVIHPSLRRQDALTNSTDTDNEFFRVPGVRKQ